MEKTILFSALMTLFFASTVFAQTPIPFSGDSSEILPQRSNSRSSSCFATISFKNTGCKRTHIYWNNNGKLVWYATINEENKWRVNTYPGHKWVFKANSRTIYRYTVKNCRNRTISVDSEGCRTSSSTSADGTTSNNTSTNCDDIYYPLPGPPFPYERIFANVYELKPEYTGSQTVSHWTVDGEQRNDRTRTPRIRVNYAQKFNVCVVFTNGGQCCKDLYLPE